MDILTSIGTGAIAGLALAVPLGAIGVLLIQEGATRGWARGLPAAAAVASVDLLYCVAAVAAGARLAPVIGAWDPWPRIVGGAALVALAARNLVRSARAGGTATGPEPPAATSSRRYALFFALTAINPATLVYFAAIVTGLSAVAASPGPAAAFVAGVALASFAWQAVLVLAGAILRRTTGDRLGRLTGVIGNGAVALLGGATIAGISL